MAKKTFYLIDGHAQIYRAYHAPFRDLTSPTGEPTKATFVFTQVLLNLVDLRKPDYLAMVIDSGDEAVFRKEIDPQYKANRAKRPDDFAPQEERILQIVRDAGIPIYAKPGMEADDLIATLAKRLGGEFDVFMVSKDKDLRQCVADGVVMYDVVADEVMDAASIREKLGYGPEQAIAVQTLVGDATDNVRGVPGVGEKTAAKLINEYGSVAGVLENADKLTPKLRENVLAFASELERTRTLVTLRTDVEFDFDPADCEFAGLDTDALRNHLDELGFKSLIARLGDGDPAKPTSGKAEVPPPKYQPLAGGLFEEEAPADGGERGEGDYKLVATEADLKAFVKALKSQEQFAFDTETDGLGAVDSDLVGMSFTWAEGTGYYLPVKGPQGSAVLPREAALAAVQPILEDPKVKKIGHNIKYDQLVMRRVGIDLQGVALDTMIAAFLIDASRNTYGMDKLSADLLNYQPIPITDLIGKGKKQITIDRVDLPTVANYAAEDTDVTLRLAGLLGPKLDQIPALRKLNDEVEIPLIDVLVEMEANGIAVDPSILKEQSEVLGGRIDALHGEIMEAAGTEFNPDSNKQLQEVLFEKLKLKPIRKTKTGYSTDLAVLEQLSSDHPVPALILEYRSLQKLKNTYLDNLQNDISPTDGRIHTSFNQTGASTGRLSSSDPNLQNIPIRTDEGRRIRLAFVPGDPKTQVLLTADYSQIELRMLAHYCEEPALMKAFDEDQDIHRAVASEVFATPLNDVTREQRGYAKTINFAIIYGVTAFGLARRIEGLNQTSAKELIDTYKKRFPGIFDFFETCITDAKRQGYVETILGRRRPIPEIESRIATMRQYAERTAINSVIQGSAADLIKVAMVNLHRRMKRENSPSKLLLQVHDELVFETPENVAEQEAAVIREEMTGAMTLKVPLKVESGWGKNWQEVK